jgi:uncharacterized sulfatase
MIKLLAEHGNQPFFLAMGFYRPHTPYVAPKKYFDLYPAASMQLPHLSVQDRERTPAAAYMSVKPEQDAKLNDDLRRQALQAYHAATTFMDAQVGRVVEELDRHGLAQNTVIVMTSDHGYHLGDHGLWQKMSIFEQSARVPLIVIAPGAAGNGKVSKRTVELVDLYPTLADLCGLPAPSYLDGKSLRPLLENPQASWDKPAFSQVQRQGNQYGGHSVRTERYRYTQWDGGKEGSELYDYQSDPAEAHNLADDPAQASTVAELRALIARNWPEGTWTPSPPDKKKKKAKAS